jgi:hypothetical protein
LRKGIDKEGVPRPACAQGEEEEPDRDNEGDPCTSEDGHPAAVDEPKHKFIGGKGARSVFAVDRLEAEWVVAQLATKALALREPVDEAILVRIANGPRAAAGMEQRALRRLGGTATYAALELVVAQHARHGGA